MVERIVDLVGSLRGHFLPKEEPRITLEDTTIFVLLFMQSEQTRVFQLDEAPSSDRLQQFEKDINEQLRNERAKVELQEHAVLIVTLLTTVDQRKIPTGGLKTEE